MFQKKSKKYFKVKKNWIFLATNIDVCFTCVPIFVMKRHLWMPQQKRQNHAEKNCFWMHLEHRFLLFIETCKNVILSWIFVRMWKRHQCCCKKIRFFLKFLNVFQFYCSKGCMWALAHKSTFGNRGNQDGVLIYTSSVWKYLLLKWMYLDVF